MCWNYSVSLYFSIVYLVINIYYIVKKPKYWQEYLIFGTFYFIMELFQTMQWLFGDVYENSITGISNCSQINVNYTIIAHILIWSQPIMFSYIGYRTNKYKNIFKYFCYLNCILLFYSLIILDRGFDSNYYSIKNSIYGLSTCTNKGSSGHLVWRFKPANIEYFPNYLMYLFLCIFSFLMYDKKEIQVIGIGWFTCLIITKIVLRPKLIEFASSWCLLSIIANGIIFINTLHIKLSAGNNMKIIEYF